MRPTGHELFERQCRHHTLTPPEEEGMAVDKCSCTEANFLGTQERVEFTIYVKRFWYVVPRLDGHLFYWAYQCLK